MKKDRSGFWEAICAEPDEDTHRLVFSDWLEEHGDSARAEFIRVQCELARLPVGDVRRVDLQIRERVLLQEHRPAWLEAVPKWITRGDYNVTFRRGFPLSLGCTGNAFLRNASAFGTRTALQEAYLDRFAPGEVARIAALPACARLRSFRSTWGKLAELQPLLTAFVGLTALHLSAPFHEEDNPSDRLTKLLALDPVLGLAQLTLRIDEDNRGAIKALAATPFRDLRTLGLEARGLTTETLAPLLRAPFLRQLTTLSLYWHKLDAPALEMLGATPVVAGLRALHLCLADAEGSGAAFAKLVGSPYLRGLTDLCISGPERECVAALDSGLTERLRTLEVWSWTSSGERGQVLPQLAGSGRLAGLVRLRVDDNKFTDDDAFALASGRLPALIHLDLNDTGLTVDGLARLAQAPHLPALRAVTVPRTWWGPPHAVVNGVRTLNARYADRFAVLVAPPGWASCSTKDLRLGVH